MISKKIWIGLATLFWGILSTNMYAATPEEILSKVKVNLDKIQTVQAYYIQTMTSSLSGREPKIESGKIVKEGQKFRKEIQKPQSKLIISTDTVYYDKNLVTGVVKTRNLDPKFHQNPFLGMSPDDILKKYTYTLNGETAEAYTLEGHFNSSSLLIEIDKKESLPRKITALIDNRPNMVITLSYITLKDIPVLKSMDSAIKMGEGNLSQEIHITLEFQDIKLNEGVNSDLFKIPVEEPKTK